MATKFFERASLPAYRARIMSLRPNSERRWGKMDATEMMAHLRRSLELSLNEIEGIEDKSNLFTRTVMRWLAFHVLPWPKGKLKSPPMFFPEFHETFETEREKLLEAMERFIDELEADPEQTGLSPFFGPVTLHYYRRMHGKHMDHHLRQFGV